MRRAGVTWFVSLAALAGGCSGGAAAAGSSSGPTRETGPCGGVTCDADEFCLYPLGDCGKAASEGAPNIGTCEPRPTSCAGNDAHQVCACDGQVYANSCAAGQAGVSLGDGEECAIPPPGTFACGVYFCKSESEWCEVLDEPDSEPLGGPARSDCEELPPSCSAMLACDCLNAAAAAAAGGHCAGPSSCTEDSDGNFTLECIGASLGG